MKKITIKHKVFINLEKLFVPLQLLLIFKITKYEKRSHFFIIDVVMCIVTACTTCPGA